MFTVSLRAEIGKYTDSFDTPNNTNEFFTDKSIPSSARLLLVILCKSFVQTNDSRAYTFYYNQSVFDVYVVVFI